MPANSSPSLKELLAYLPILLSLTAIAVTTIAIVLGGAAREADEGTAAHLFQLCMAGSFLVSVAFAIRWLAHGRWQTVRILGLQVAAALVALAPVFYFKL